MREFMQMDTGNMNNIAETQKNISKYIFTTDMTVSSLKF